MEDQINYTLKFSGKNDMLEFSLVKVTIKTENLLNDASI